MNTNAAKPSGTTTLRTRLPRGGRTTRPWSFIRIPRCRLAGGWPWSALQQSSDRGGKSVPVAPLDPHLTLQRSEYDSRGTDCVRAVEPLRRPAPATGNRPRAAAELGADGGTRTPNHSITSRPGAVQRRTPASVEAGLRLRTVYGRRSLFVINHGGSDIGVTSKCLRRASRHPGSYG